MTDIMVGLLSSSSLSFTLCCRSGLRPKSPVYEDEYGPEQNQRSQLDMYRIAVTKQQNIILEGLQSFFESEGFTNVTIDRSNGVLRFPDGVLFGAVSTASRTDTNRLAVTTLANAFAEVLPCSVRRKGNRFWSKADCRLGHLIP